MTVKDIVIKALTQINKKEKDIYAPNIIDQVLCVIESTPSLRAEYDQITSRKNLNSRIGKRVRKVLLLQNSGQTQPSATKNLANTYTPLINADNPNFKLGKISLYGQAKYQATARKIFPILVRQAKARQLITYGTLAKEIGMPNPRNMNFPLGCIGDALIILSRIKNKNIPALQLIVVGKSNHVPGTGAAPYTSAKDYSSLSISHKKLYQEQELIDIYEYAEWDQVLQDLNLEPATPVTLGEPTNHSEATTSQDKDGVESPEHEALKHFIANNPQIVKAAPKAIFRTEMSYHSGDRIDLAFPFEKQWLGVEVKPSTANEDEFKRGLFQCVKYQALTEATNRIEGKTLDIKIILATNGIFPRNLIPLKNALGITILDQINLPQDWIDRYRKSQA